jgi:RimJ/RimL family protein N-acetyltransferase
MSNFDIETARLRLRPLAPKDFDQMCEIWNEPGVKKYLWDDETVTSDRAEPVLKASIDDFQTHGFGIWSLIDKQDGALVGFCGLRFVDDTPEIEILYGITTSHWGRGLSAEAARAVLGYGFERLKLDRIVAITNAPNRASVRVMEKACLKFEKRFFHHQQDSIMYSMSREDFSPDKGDL